MSRKQIAAVAGIGVAALALGLTLGRSLAPEPAISAHTAVDGHEHATAAAVPGAAMWTCSMHPQIMQPEPGNCPICGMALIPVQQGADDAGPRTLTMSESARALAEIQTTLVERRFPEAELRLVGKLDYDETRLRSLTARFPMRIDQLLVNYTGIVVNAGEHLARVYSPELLTAQRELLTAVRYDSDSSIAQVARDKLRLWDLLPEQIDEIVAAGTASDQIEIRAPIGGVVVEKNVKEGDYVQRGQAMFRIADLSKLWLNLDAYESDLAWLRYGQPVNFQVESLPGETFEGRIVFIGPVVNSRTRTVSVRVDVPNEQGRLKPGMFARSVVYSKVARGGKVFSSEFAGKWIGPMHPEIVKDGPGKCDICGMDLVPAESLGYVATDDEEPPLVVPTSAVLRTGRRAVVYVVIPGRDRPTYEGREISIGPRAGGMFLVTEGLQEGEEVVTNGAFKIDSALQIQAKPSMMSPEGGGLAPAHDHGAMDRSGGAAATLSTSEAKQLLAPYFQLHAALAGDNLAAAKQAIDAALEAVGPGGAVAGVLREMQVAEDLAAIRRPHFETLSNALIAAVRADESALMSTVYWMHCPMVYPDRGADWLQRDADVFNPYFGASMPTCGNQLGVLGEGQAASEEP